MKWSDTTASKCRYGEIVGEVFEDTEIFWEHSEADYQGSANVLAYNHKSGCFLHYEWSYGSCSGCDTWEAEGLSDTDILIIVRRDTSVIGSLYQFRQYIDKWPNKDEIEPALANLVSRLAAKIAIQEGIIDSDLEDMILE